MRWTKSHSVFSVAAVACVALAYWGLHLSQGEESLQTARIAPGAKVAEVSGRQAPSAAATGGTEYLPPCRQVSPFAKNVNCAKELESSAGAGPFGDGAGPSGDSADDILPQFENVYALGSVGNGVVAKALQSAGRAMAGTASNNDSVLLDVSAAEVEAPLLNNINQALDEGKFVIIDGGDSKASSSKLNELMADINLLKIEGVTAYGVMKRKDGAYEVTPLQSVVGANGKREFDQLHNVLGINKPGVGM